MKDQINTIKTKIDGVYLLTPVVYSDIRGKFLESYNQQKYKKLLKIKKNFVQDNCSISKKGVIRGIHYQEKYKQGKLIRVSRGSVYDVVVDIRKKSKTFGLWESFKLNAKNMHQLYIPPGLAHGFLSLSDETIFEYKCTNYYNPKYEKTIIWNDRFLNIFWPIKNPILSKKDKKGQGFLELFDK